MIRAEQSIHFEGKKRRFLDVAHDAFKVAHYSYKQDTVILPNDFQVANSEFTRDALLRVYPDLKQEVPVLYPPVEESQLPVVQKDPKLVVSLGRFSPDKRQMEQIKIAAQVPELKFVLMGFINSKPYFEACQAEIEQRGLTNVTLLGDAPKKQVNKTLASATYFIHNLRNEPFGITAVQGIQAGCLPLVHNSGGQREVVPFADLRYETIEDATRRLKSLIRWSEERKSQVLSELQKGCKRFEATTFASAFNDLVQPYL